MTEARPASMSNAELGERLEGHLRKEMDRPGLRLGAIEAIPEGHSGFTYFVTASDAGWTQRMVLRLPPPGARIAGPADVLRQGRIMAALHDHGLPTPRIIANCEDPGVLDGRPFCLMEAVGGVRIEKALQEYPSLQIAECAVRTLKRIQGVPVGRTGIGEEHATPLTEEMIRWSWLMSRAPEELTTAAPTLGARLAERKPADPPPTLVHADYHYGNMLFGRGVDGLPEVVAVLDWEISEIGAPLLDLGCLCVVAQRRNEVPDAPNPGGGIDVEIDDVIRLYGADPVESRWYLALSCYKYASIFGYNLMLHRRGKRPDPMYENLTGVITALIDSGMALLD
ncbi:MAG: phosphotransferase family protein [Candidatus Dormibacteraeota bacterium]|nr:phosphotransferase family protein [Candidatus Dormibacteraeota bacterium]